METNPITVKDLPTTNSILSSDRIIVFVDSDGNFKPNLLEISELSGFFASEEEYKEVEEKTKAVANVIKQAIDNLKKNYVSKTTAAETYSTISNFNNVISKFQTLSGFNDLLSSKATQSFFEVVYSECKKWSEETAEKYLHNFNSKNSYYGYLRNFVEHHNHATGYGE